MATSEEKPRSDSTGKARSDSLGKPRSSSLIDGRPRSDSKGPPARVIVLAVDASEHAKYAFEWFLHNIHRPDDLIVLTHCPETPSLPLMSFKSGMAPPVDEWKKSLDTMNASTRKLEEDYEGTLIVSKLRYKVRGETSRKPGEGIINVAEEEGADMICMGTRGLGGIKRALMGSVSEYVVRHSPCPVTVIPMRKK